MTIEELIDRLREVTPEIIDSDYYHKPSGVVQIALRVLSRFEPERSFILTMGLGEHLFIEEYPPPEALIPTITNIIRRTDERLFGVKEGE